MSEPLEISVSSPAFVFLAGIMRAPDTYSVSIVPHPEGVSIRRNAGTWSPVLPVGAIEDEVVLEHLTRAVRSILRLADERPDFR